MQIQVQFARFVVVGLVSNAVLFLVYLGMTYIGVNYKLAVSILYVFAVLQTFIFNKRWSFQHEGNTRRAFGRYLVVYGLGYLLNLAILVALVDVVGFPHQIVQGIMIIVFALVLFLLQKVWVFNEARLQR